MEPLTRAVRVVTSNSVDVQELADVAARTFPLACPPSMAPGNIAAFVAANLSAARFGEYLADPHRAILTAEVGGRMTASHRLCFDELGLKRTLHGL